MLAVTAYTKGNSPIRTDSYFSLVNSRGVNDKRTDHQSNIELPMLRAKVFARLKHNHTVVYVFAAFKYVKVRFC